MRVIALLTLLLAACGQSGDLYLPEEQPPAPTTAPDAKPDEKRDEKKDR